MDDYKFELFKQGAGPVGIGFSTDGTMGGDLVIQCNKVTRTNLISQTCIFLSTGITEKKIS